MLVLNNINKSFKNIKVLKNISFTLQENRIFAFLGPNGVGKTTLIKIISGLISADSGTVLLDDKKISMDKISTMFDGSRNLYWNISVRENFYYSTALKGRFKKEVDYLLEKNKEIFQIDNLLDKKYGELSLGQKQIVAVINTLLSSPELACFDEPSNGLDIYYEEKLIQIISNYIKNDSNKIIISSHDINFLYKVVDNFIVINKGEIIGEFSKNNLSLEEVTAKYLELLEGKKWKSI